MVSSEDYPSSHASHITASKSLRLTQSVFLIGFMGAGKTSVARRLARICGASSIDSDVYIGRSLDMKSSDFIREYGIDAFRALETDALRTLVQLPPAFISLGGGIVEVEENRRIISSSGTVIFLDVSAACAASRISNFESRPLFGDLDSAEQLNVSRRPLYLELAHARVETANKKVSALANEVLECLQSLGVLVASE